ncbi:MAG: DUF1730 domain-containing protein [Defluviitaleaceae bacterium]|nr:DUF1730 domain-containing protein [Defluviitaleaceae bacterium]
MTFVQSFAEKHNILAGVCDAAPLEVSDSARLASPFVPFVSADAERRVNPSVTLPGVESIVVVGVPIFGGEVLGGSAPVAWASSPPLGGRPAPEPPQGSKAPLTPSLGGGRFVAQLSSLGAGEDYHVRVKKILGELVGELEKTHGAFEYKILVDSPGLDERALAHRAGLGFFGRNGLLISKKFGSRFNIGCVLTSLNVSFFEEGRAGGGTFFSKKISPENFACPDDCNLCIKSCPNGALGEKNLRVERCISYLTQKDELSPDEEKMLHGQLFGCDICQDVCPFNAHMPRASACVDLAEWLKMSDEEFEKKYGRTGMLWRGTEILRRNARLAKRVGECHSPTLSEPCSKF